MWQMVTRLDNTTSERLFTYLLVVFDLLDVSSSICATFCKILKTVNPYQVNYESTKYTSCTLTVKMPIKTYLFQISAFKISCFTELQA